MTFSPILHEASQTGWWLMRWTAIIYLFHHLGITFPDLRFLWLDCFHQLFLRDSSTSSGMAVVSSWPNKSTSPEEFFLAIAFLAASYYLVLSAVKSTLRYSMFALNSPSARPLKFCGRHVCMKLRPLRMSFVLPAAISLAYWAGLTRETRLHEKSQPG